MIDYSSNCWSSIELDYYSNSLVYCSCLLDFSHHFLHCSLVSLYRSADLVDCLNKRSFDLTLDSHHRRLNLLDLCYLLFVGLRWSQPY